ncbi:hypothetical protein LLEC1_04758 [Akanthomyces lecanii]|uniref:Major facilitator superfamily (MFS) profile domain-containing protein n=1 Tax=Cordyceps confragosa TaxID=2714763 RepID=A0A179I5M9_CORDF|nr:hypothetical protein LLEC1_04758 [Akanthomyces lecanii]
MSHISEHRLSADGTTINVDLSKEADGYSTPLETPATPSSPSPNKESKQAHTLDAPAAVTTTTTTTDNATPTSSTFPDDNGNGKAPPVAPEAQRTKLETTLVMVALCIALFLAALDMTIVTTAVSWRWCFWVNLPCGGLAFAILLFFLKLHNPRTPVKAGLAAIDWVGNILIVGGTIMLLMGLEFGGSQYPWNSATVISLIVFGVVAIAIFLAYESRIAKFPVIPVRLFDTRTSIATYVTSSLHAFTFISGSYYLPLYFQSVLGANSLLSGVYLLPFVSVMSLMSAFVGFFINKTGKYKIVITSGLVLSTLGFGLFTYLGDRPHWERIVLFQMVAGLGIGPNFQAPLIALQANVAPRDIGAATSSLQFVRQLCTATSVAVGGVVIANRMQAQQGHLTAELGADVARLFAGTDAASNVDRIKTLPVDDRQLVRTAYWNSIQIMFAVFTCSCFLGLVASLFIKQTTLSKQHTEHKTGLQTLKAEERKKNQNSDEEAGNATAVVAPTTEK